MTRMQKLMAFNQDILNLTTGEELRNGCKLNLFADLRPEFGKWKAHLDHSRDVCECAMC